MDTEDTRSHGGNADDRPERTRRANERRDALDSVSIAALDVDSRIFRTLWHSLVRAPVVARAALEGDYSRYISPVRVFVAMFGLQFVVASLFGTPLTGSLEQLSSGLPPEQVAAWLTTGQTAQGTVPTAADVDSAIESWGAILLWPITVVTSLPYLFLLKAYRPSIPLWGHVQLYLVPTNASFLIMIAAIPTLVGGLGWFYLGLAVAMLVYLVVTGWLIVRFYSHSIAGAALRLLGLCVMMPVTMILAGLGQFLGTAITLHYKFGLSVIELFLPPTP